MAENGHLNDNNNKSSRPSLNPEIERTESDAVHARLRNDLHPSTSFICQSCNRQFQATSIIQVYEHYSQNEHSNYFGLCLYCNGFCHQYQEESTKRTQIYHNCLRWKRGENN